MSWINSTWKKRIYFILITSPFRNSYPIQENIQLSKKVTLMLHNIIVYNMHDYFSNNNNNNSFNSNLLIASRQYKYLIFEKQRQNSILSKISNKEMVLLLYEEITLRKQCIAILILTILFYNFKKELWACKYSFNNLFCNYHASTKKWCQLFVHCIIPPLLADFILIIIKKLKFWKMCEVKLLTERRKLVF